MSPTGLRDAHTLLAAWEEAAATPEVARSAVLVAHDGGVAIETALDLPLAACAVRAVAAYVDAFGPAADGSCSCHACGEAIEVLLDLRDVAAADGPVAQEIVTVGEGSRSTTVRALTTRDLLAAGDAADPVTFLRLCTVRDGAEQALPGEVLAALPVDDLAALDAAAERLAGVASILLRMQCPACGDAVAASLDPGLLLWERVAAAAPLLLAEVAVLARAFGWSEEAVLALGTARRRAYLGLAREMAAVP